MIMHHAVCSLILEFIELEVKVYSQLLFLHWLQVGLML